MPVLTTIELSWFEHRRCCRDDKLYRFCRRAIASRDVTSTNAIEPEQSTLKFSIALTVFLGMLGVASGLVTNSQAIIFDGMYSFVDVVPTVVSLLVVKLIARGNQSSLPVWVLAPGAAGGRAARRILVVACIYAAIDAVKALTGGGHEVEYGRAALWAGILCVIGFSMTHVPAAACQGTAVPDARSGRPQLGGEHLPQPGAADRVCHWPRRSRARACKAGSLTWMRSRCSAWR